MKKAVVIFLLVVYGSATIGATVHVHYCMNKYIGSSVWSGNPKFCTNCGMAKEKSHGCCKDECRQVKLQADQQLTSPGYCLAYFSANAMLQRPDIASAVNVFSPVTVQAVSHAPPGYKNKRLYLQNRMLLI